MDIYVQNFFCIFNNKKKPYIHPQVKTKPTVPNLNEHKMI